MLFGISAGLYFKGMYNVNLINGYLQTELFHVTYIYKNAFESSLIANDLNGLWLFYLSVFSNSVLGVYAY